MKEKLRQCSLILKTHQTFHSKIGQNYICFSRSVRNLGVIFDDKLSMKQQVSKIYQPTYPELRRISSVRHVLTVEVIKTLVTSLVVSHLWYCHLPGIVTSLVLSHVWYCHMPGIVTSLVVSHFRYCHIPGIVTSLVLSHLW